MKIEALKASFPSRVVSNNEILALIKDHSRDSFEGDLDGALYTIWEGLRYSGAKSRRWLAANETPMQLLNASVDAALAAAGCEKTDIDLLIYSGVDRGFAEPANANLVANALGFRDVECFDVLEACNGWSRAVQLSHALFSTGRHERILILDCEFPLFPGGSVFPALYKLRSPEDIATRLPGYTLGEVATATVLSRDGSPEWEFHFSGRNDLADLCTIPLWGFERYCGSSDRIGRNGVGVFTSFGREMLMAGIEPSIQVFKRLKTPVSDIRTIFPHAVSQTTAKKIAEAVGVEHLLYYIYPDFGNLASASVPAAIDNAIREGRTRPGDRMVSWVGSAGMSFSVISFEL